MQATRTVRTESPERWTRALARALAAGIDALEVGGSTMWAVESQSRPGTVFLVNEDAAGCGCEAALAGDRICAHRALIRFLIGELALPQVECGACRGSGYQAVGVGGWEDSVRCGGCAGTGTVEATLAQAVEATTCARCRGAGWVEVDEWVDGAVFAVATACGCEAGVAWEAEMVARAEAEADRRLAA